MTVEFRDYVSGEYIKQWPFWNGVVPIPGDIVLLHFGDYNEKEQRFRVKERVISGKDSLKIVLYIEAV